MVQLRRGLRSGDFPFPGILTYEGLHFLIDLELLKVRVADHLEQLYVGGSAQLPVTYNVVQTIHPFLFGGFVIRLESNDEVVVQY